MKKSVFFVLLAGLLLVAGVSYRAFRRAGTAEPVSSANPPQSGAVSDSGPSSAQTAVQTTPETAPRMAVSKTKAPPQETVQISTDSSARFQPLDESKILEQRVSTVSKDRKKRELLVRSEGKYPYRRVEETLVKNEGSDTYTIAARTEMVATHVLVKLQDGKTEADLKSMLSGYGVSILRALSLPGHYIVALKAPTLDAVPEALSVFGGESNVLAYVEPDYVSRVNAAPNDTRWSELWGMVKINATGAWDVITGSTNVIVAVIDTGVSLAHPDLSSNIWKNVTELNGVAGVDDDGNGYVDDVNGWDFAGDDNNPDDSDKHGTHCAGTIGAVGNNTMGVAGVCWKLRLMALRGGSGSGLLQSDTAEAVHYAADNGAKIISASYGGGAYSDTERAALNYANGKGVLFVAAAGNESTDNDTVPHYPSGYDLPNIVSVAATDRNDALASFSNYGKTSVDLAAPGVEILSTVPGGTYEEMQGTSMATPHVAGAAALLLSAKPGLTHLQLKQALLDTVDPVAALANKTVSGGRLNVRSLIVLQDTDGDGMPDEWETENGLNPNNPVDASADPDSDHLNNRGEYENRCVITNPDTDTDTLWDGWEVTYGFNPNSPTGGLASSSRLGGFSLSSAAKNITVAGNYAYVAAEAAGLVVLNVADPERPTQAGLLDTAGSANDVTVSNAYAYVADGPKGISVINVSNPLSPFLVATYDTDGVAKGISVQGTWAYLADGSSGKVQTFDISAPSNPVPSVTPFVRSSSMNDIFVQGNSAYVATLANVFRLDISNPAVPQAHTNSAGFIGESIDGIHGNSSLLAAAAGTYGVKILNNDSINDRVALAKYNTDGTAYGVFVSGNYVYVADGTNGLVVLDVRTPSAPVQAARIETHGTAYGVFVNGDKVYLAESTGVEIFSVLPDADADGILDSWETQYFGGIGQSSTNDYDGDGISNWGEYLAGLNPTNSDQDADGLIDGTQEVRLYNTDPRVADTDGDGLTDGDEVSRGTKPLVTDTDGDGMTDGWEVRYGFDPLDVLDPGPNNDATEDNDGLTNLEESQNGTDPTDADTDDDGMPDGWEVDHGLNPLVNDAALDPDSDGLTNLQEYTLGTHPKDSDTDDDGMPDGWENTHGLNPLANDASGDADSDGLTNLGEYQNNTDPNDSDTDNDGMPDGWEVTHYLDPLANDASGDPDTDGLKNLQEYSLVSNSLWLAVYTNVPGTVSSFSFGMPGSTDPRDSDSDNDGLNDLYEITTNGTSNLYITNPNNADTDGDGLPDKWELDQIPASNPTVPALPTDDSDGDGLKNGEEDALGTNPANRKDPVFVNCAASTNDPAWYDPQESDPHEDGTWNPTNSALSHPFDAIQEAVNVASNGMTVLVTNGTYWGEGNYNINPQGKAIRIISWNNDPTNTIVNSLGYGPVFTLNSGETTNTVIKGLGITVTLSDCSDGDCDFEHALVLSNASPKIESCLIYDGQLNGIHCVSGSSPVIRDCTMSRFLNGVWCEGGASLRIENCTVLYSDYRGNFECDFKRSRTGIYVELNSGLYITNVVVSGCQGRGIVVKNCPNAVITDTDVSGCGGGMTFDASSPRTERCIVENNQARNHYLYKNWYAAETNLFPLGEEDYTEVIDEDENGGGILLLRGSSPLMVNCLVVSNRTWAEDPKFPETKLVPDYGLGGGFYIGSGCSPTGVNCTVADNHANTRGGGLSSFQSPFLRNMIFWGNTSSNAAIVDAARVSTVGVFPNLHCRSGSINIWYSDIQYGYPTAVLSTTNDPLFIGGGDYHLSSSNSPCYNKGTFYLAPLLDLDGRERPTAYPDRVDMGCYEYGATLPAPEAIVNPQTASAGGSAPDPLADTDGDGFTNGEEITSGTDIYDETDYFRVYHQQSQADGSVLVAWQSIVGSVYTVQSTDSLTGTWVNQSGYVNLAGTGGVMTFSGSLPSGSRFYRVLVRQP
jgi:subtilisin family serine protease